MLYILGTFIKRVPREKFKSLSASALALVLVFLISIMYGVRDRQSDELEYVIDNFEVRVEVSDPINRKTEGLLISDRISSLFTNADSPLSRLVRDTELRRKYVIYDPSDVTRYTEEQAQWQRDAEALVGNLDDPTLDWEWLLGILPLPIAPVSTGEIYSITSLAADIALDSSMGVYIGYFDGYDEDVFRGNEHAAVVSEEIYSSLDPENPVITASIWSEWSDTLDLGDYWSVFVKLELPVAGIVHGAGNRILVPFTAVSEKWRSETEKPAYSEIMSAVISENRLIDEFKLEAKPHFATGGVVDVDRPFALTVFDGRYIEMVGTLRQNISLIGIATPFVFALSACIGFVVSFLLTRRRKQEFAVLRSIGVRKTHVFLAALLEQLALCAVGSAAGLLLYFAVWKELMPATAVIFTACYTLGAAISAARAAGTDVLKILREKE